MIETLAYRLCSTTDPEDRLEDAAIWKAMRDEFGDAIVAVAEDEAPPSGIVTFGRNHKFAKPLSNPVPRYLPYWTDPAFVAHAGRSFETLAFEEAIKAVDRLHALGKGAFLKSTRLKHGIFRVPVGADLRDELGAMIYSFIDGGPKLMVQELCTVEFEFRFFCIAREVVAYSPVQWSLTPLDKIERGKGYRTPRDQAAISVPEFEAIATLAAEVARTMRQPHAVVDCALFNGRPAVVEFNPLRIGECGLYACDVRALAKATRKLVEVTA